LTVEEMENRKSDGDKYIPKDISDCDSSSDGSKGHEEKRDTKKMAKRVFSCGEEEYEPEARGRIHLSKKPKHSSKRSKPAEASRYADSSEESYANKASSSDKDGKKVEEGRVQKKPSKAAKRARDCKDLEDEAKTESAPEKPTCPKCDKTFENTSNVIRHLKNIHKVKARAPELKASVANMGQYKRLPCKYCRKMLTNLAMHNVRRR
jgi:Zinc finger, C2H2 type